MFSKLNRITPPTGMAKSIFRTATSLSSPQTKFVNATHNSSCSCQQCGGGKVINERHLSSEKSPSATNRGVIFLGPQEVEVKGIPFPALELDSTFSPVVSERQKRKCPQ